LTYGDGSFALYACAMKVPFPNEHLNGYPINRMWRWK